MSPEFSSHQELAPPSDVLASMNLKAGRNLIEFSVVSGLQGELCVACSLSKGCAFRISDLLLSKVDFSKRK